MIGNRNFTPWERKIKEERMEKIVCNKFDFYTLIPRATDSYNACELITVLEG
jgi:hypothetical protein